MVETANPQRLYPTSILDVYKVFEQLEMLWMGIWVHPYTVTPIRVGMDLRDIGAWLSPPQRLYPPTMAYMQSVLAA